MIHAIEGICLTVLHCEDALQVECLLMTLERVQRLIMTAVLAVTISLNVDLW